MYHYVYKLEHTETKEYYIGVRSSESLPSLDPYLGSMQTWKPDKNKLVKSILKDNFESREEAMKFERETILLNFEDSLNMNFNIPGENFHTLGMVHVKDKEGNCFLVPIDDERIKNKELNYFWEGRKHSEEAKKKMSESAKTRKTTEENESIRRSKISASCKGKKPSAEYIEIMKVERRGENNPYIKYLKANGLEHPRKGKIYEKQECPHCKRMISKSIIKVKHLDNCKMKLD
jgi:hypothetical protein